MQYYCLIGDEEIGPMEAEQVRKLAQSGVLTASGLIRRESDDEWIAAGAIANLLETDSSSLPKRSADKRGSKPEKNPRDKLSAEIEKRSVSSRKKSNKANGSKRIKAKMGCYRGSTAQTFTGAGFSWKEIFAVHEIELQQPRRGFLTTRVYCPSCDLEIPVDVLSKKECRKRWYKTEDGKFFLGSLVTIIFGVLLAILVTWITSQNGVFETFEDAANYIAWRAGLILLLPMSAMLLALTGVFDRKHDRRVEVLDDPEILLEHDQHKIFLHQWKGDA